VTTPSITVSPSALDFVVRRGSTLRRTITWYSDPVWLDVAKTQLDTETSVPLDLTGYAGRMQVRDKNSGVQMFELTTENGGLTFGGSAGTITFFLSDTSTEQAQSDDGEYDFEVVEPSSDVVPLLAGLFTLSDQVTA